MSSAAQLEEFEMLMYAKATGWFSKKGKFPNAIDLKEIQA